ncbi:Pre-mRNA_splicing factor RNA helicase [Hexamita inflata]|uniref:Pre-mRNA splicing factor RNA helicase n=1 Tax=Hexamita inflata TaxID=28002 RepID=A0AA86QAU1_9EUKA|nr:Pre-mRNA splicing factor RNA helicase [Hexamita inflata]
MSATPDLQIISLLPEKNEQKLIMKIDNCSPFNISQIRIKANSVKEAVATVPAKQAVDFIHEMLTKQKPIGNILCFTSGKMECEDICEQTIQGLKDNNNVVCVDFSQFKNMNVYAVHEELRKISAKSDKLVVVPIVMAGQATELEKTIASDPIPEDFSHKCIKVIAATNIAETSITIEDLVCLIDSGMFKEASWDDKKGIRILKEKQISAAQRTQRVGRVGRVRDGFAYLIDVDSSQKVEQQKPEISRIDLKQIILELRDIQINLEDIKNSLPTQPDSDQLKYNLETLQKVQALDENYQITELGKKLAQYQDINPLAGIIFEKLLKQNGQLYLLISIFAYFLSQTHNFIQNYQSGIAKDCFTEESDIATMIKCVIAIEEIEEGQRQQFCVLQEVQFSVFQKQELKQKMFLGQYQKQITYNITFQVKQHYKMILFTSQQNKQILAYYFLYQMNMLNQQMNNNFICTKIIKIVLNSILFQILMQNHDIFTNLIVQRNKLSVLNGKDVEMQYLIVTCTFLIQNLMKHMIYMLEITCIDYKIAINQHIVQTYL